MIIIGTEFLISWGGYPTRDGQGTHEAIIISGKKDGIHLYQTFKIDAPIGECLLEFERELFKRKEAIK